MRKTHYNRGIITLVYILFIAVIATFVLAIGSSRILLTIAWIFCSVSKFKSYNF
jgi:hypothetical protein